MTNAFFQRDVGTLVSIDRFLRVSAALKSSVGLSTHLSPRGGPYAQLTPLLAMIPSHGYHSCLPLQQLNKLTPVSWNGQRCQPRPCQVGVSHIQWEGSSAPQRWNRCHFHCLCGQPLPFPLPLQAASVANCTSAWQQLWNVYRWGQGLTTAAWIIHQEKHQRCFYSSFQARWQL